MLHYPICVIRNLIHLRSSMLALAPQAGRRLRPPAMPRLAAIATTAVAAFAIVLGVTGQTSGTMLAEGLPEGARVNRPTAGDYGITGAFDSFAHFELLEEFEMESPESSKMVPKKLQCSCTFEKIAPIVTPQAALLETRAAGPARLRSQSGN